MQTMFKKGCMKTAAIFLTVVMLSSIMKVPVVYAYFTAEAKSDVLEFQIIAIPSAMATVTFVNPFLFEEGNEAEQRGTGPASLQGTRQLIGLAQGVAGTLASPSGDDAAGAFDTVISGQERVQAEVRLADGFAVADIDLFSVKLHYGGNAAFAAAGELDGDEALVVDFDRQEIAAWFAGTDEEMEYVTFVVTGEGYSGGTDRFRFAAEAALLFKGSYGVTAVAIDGPDGFFIPPPAGTATGVFTLVDQAGATLQGVQWALQKPVAGVEMEAGTGALTVSSSAPEGAITILALLESEGRTLLARKPFTLYAQPAAAIDGAGSITIPPLQKIMQEEYRIEATPDLHLTSVDWELQGALTGISVDSQGRVTVDGDAAAESFTLLARLQVSKQGLHIPLTLQKEISLETIVVSAVEIRGETQITIPDGGPESYVYDAAVYDPAGFLLADEAVNWYLEGESYGVALNPVTGILTVENSAAAGSITVVAAAERDAGVSAYKTVNLEEPARETAAPGNPPAGEPGEPYLQIEGSTVVYIPAPGDDDTATAEIYYYTAQVFDGEGQPLEGPEVVWSLIEAADGVSLNAAGELTVTSAAGAGTVWLAANSLSPLETSAIFEVELLTGEEIAAEEDPPATEPAQPGGSAGEEDKEATLAEDDGEENKDGEDKDDEVEADDEIENVAIKDEEDETGINNDGENDEENNGNGGAPGANSGQNEDSQQPGGDPQDPQEPQAVTPSANQRDDGEANQENPEE